MLFKFFFALTKTELEYVDKYTNPTVPQEPRNKEFLAEQSDVFYNSPNHAEAKFEHDPKDFLPP